MRVDAWIGEKIRNLTVPLNPSQNRDAIAADMLQQRSWDLWIKYETMTYLKKVTYLPKILVLAMSLLPVMSQAAFVLDTGTPTGTGGPLEISSADLVGAEFSATAGEDITQLSAYLAPGAGNGNSLIFDIFSGNLVGSHATKTLIGAMTATFSGTTGWTSTDVNWVVPTTGNYWFVIQGNGGGTTFDAPLETSTTTGTVPAREFVFSSNSGSSFSSSPSGIGLEVSVSAPEPATYGSIAGAGLLTLAVCAPRRQSFRREASITSPGKSK
jgi:hypothetical protein